MMMETASGKCMSTLPKVVGLVCAISCDRIEVFIEEQSCGFLTPLDTGINSRVRRTANLDIELFPGLPTDDESYQGGSLFEEPRK